MKNYSIKAKNINKDYKIYENASDRLKEFLLRGESYHSIVHALKDISICIEKGKTIGLIGRNGSGKSTFLQIVAGIVRPTSGEIEVNGRVSALLELGAGFNPEFTGIENIYLVASIYGLDKQEINDKLDEIIAFADIGDFINRPVKTFSSGMFVRLAFSIATMVEPEILLVDEALAVGDFIFQEKCIQRMKKIKEEEKTILFVSHELGRIRMLCDRIYWFENGKIFDWSDGDEVVDKYIDYMRSEIGDSKKNNNISKKQDSNADNLKNNDIEMQDKRNAYLFDIRLMNAQQVETNQFKTGDDVIITFSYHCLKKIKNPCVGIVIKRNDEVFVTQISNLGDSVAIKELEGTGSIALRFMSIPLLSGEYNFSLHLKDDQVLFDYDRHLDICPFKVTTPKNKNGYDINWGLVQLEHDWIVT